MLLSHQQICEEIESALREEHTLLRGRFYAGDPSIRGIILDEAGNQTSRPDRDWDPRTVEGISEVTIIETLDCFAKLMSGDENSNWADFVRMPSEDSPLRLAWDTAEEMREVPTRGTVAYMREMILSTATYWQMLYETGSAFLLRRAAWFKEFGPLSLHDAMLEVHSNYDDRMGSEIINGLIGILSEAYHISPALFSNKTSDGMSRFFLHAVDKSNNIAMTARHVGIRLETILFSVRMHNCLLIENMMQMPIAVGTFVMLVHRLTSIVEYWRGVITSDVVHNAEALIDSLGLGEGNYSDSYVQNLMSSNQVVKNKIMEVISET